MWNNLQPHLLPKERLMKSMYLDSDKKFIMDKFDGKEYIICEAVFIVKDTTDLLTMKHKDSVRIYNKFHDFYCTVELPRSAFSKSIASKLCDYGVSISAESPENAEHLIDFILSTEANAEHVFSHNQLGFAEVNGRSCFLAHRPIALKPPEKDAKKFWCDAMSKSEYTNPRKTKPRGTFRSWRKVMQREVIGRPKLELALALGALAPISHILREAGIVTDLPMAAWVGPSSIGKTASLRIIASIYGVPSVGDGFISNMHSTVNGLYAQLAANYGAPAIFDEVTGTVDMDLSSIIYFMPNGRDKVRCNPDGSLKEPVKFSGAIFFSSEKSLFESTINTEGLHARLVEFPFVWTASKQNAQCLERQLNANCGTAVYPLLKWLMNQEDWLIETYKEEYERLCTEHARINPKASNVSNRVLKIYAQILVAARAASISLNLPLAIPEMRKLLLRTLKDNPVAEVNIEDEYDAVKAFYLDNKPNFPEHTKYPSLYNTVWGFTKPYMGVEEVWIRKDVLENLLQRISNRDSKAILKDFVKNGWLYQDDSRHRCFKYTIAGVHTWFYRLRLGKQQATTVKSNAKKRTPMSRSPQLQSLLA